MKHTQTNTNTNTETPSENSNVIQKINLPDQIHL